MLELRITAFHDLPDSEILRKYAANGFNLFHDTDTDLYFLTDGPTYNFDLNGFGSDYHRVLNIPFDYDWSYLKAFKANHNDLLKHTLIHDEILMDALALSKVFSTRVLCVYSNDEDCDFAVTAEDGNLLRLRFKAGRKQGKRVDDSIAHKIETEIQATRILMDGEEPSANEVFEYNAFEALQTQDKPLALYSFWQFREGEIDGHVIFDTITSTPKGTEPNLFFRNAFLEFKEAFGKTPPDFTDMPQEKRFQRIAFQAPPKISIFAKALNFIKSLLALITSSRKAILWSLGFVVILAAAISSDKSERPNKQKTFEDYCASARGAISGEFVDQCKVDNITYRNWNLPGVKGERRVIILKIGPQQIPCTDIVERNCLVVDGEIFYDHIEGFTFRQGKQQIVPVERIQVCDLEADNDCPQDAGIFRFKQLLDLGK